MREPTNNLNPFEMVQLSLVRRNRYFLSNQFSARICFVGTILEEPITMNNEKYACDRRQLWRINLKSYRCSSECWESWIEFIPMQRFFCTNYSDWIKLLAVDVRGIDWIMHSMTAKIIYQTTPLCRICNLPIWRPLNIIQKIKAMARHTSSANAIQFISEYNSIPIRKNDWPSHELNENNYRHQHPTHYIETVCVARAIRGIQIYVLIHISLCH